MESNVCTKPDAKSLSDEAFGSGADEVVASGLEKRLSHELAVLGVAVLDERALHGLFVRRFCHVDRLHRAWVEPRVVHAGRNRRGRGIEILDLLGVVAHVTYEFGKLDGIGERCAGQPDTV